MQNATCPKCGSNTARDADCPCNDHAVVNGAVVPNGVKSLPPPEVTGWVITPTAPEELERLRREFNEEEWLAAAREIETTGGVSIDDVIAKIERNVYGDR